MPNEDALRDSKTMGPGRHALEGDGVPALLEVTDRSVSTASVCHKCVNRLHRGTAVSMPAHCAKEPQVRVSGRETTPSQRLEVPSVNAK